MVKNWGKYAFVLFPKKIDENAHEDAVETLKR